jgi:hypothetical protein
MFLGGKYNKTASGLTTVLDTRSLVLCPPVRTVVPMKIALQYREHARRVYHGATFKAKE